MPLVLNGTTGVQDNSGAFVQGTSVASTSGTSIDFTSIPSWVKRVTVTFFNVSTNGSAALQVQLFATTLTTSGYTGYSARSGGANVYTSFSSAFVTSDGIASSYSQTGTLVLTNITGNTWIVSGSLTNTAAINNTSVLNGSVALASALTGVRFTTTNGTDTFDAGTINILYE